jgi:lipoprotein-releasing system permease protein
MSWQIFIACRYLTSKRKEKFISIISLISILGVAIGVAALIIVIAVMAGFDEDLKDKIVGTYSHIEIISDYGIRPDRELEAKILDTNNVKALSFFLNAQALIRRGDSVTGVIVKGIVPGDELKVKEIGRYMKKGSLGDVAGGGIVIGSELAAKLGAGIGDTVTLISPSAKMDAKPLMIMPGNVEKADFRVSGIFTSGMYEYDMNLVYVELARAQEMLGVKGLASGAAIRVDDIYDVTGVKNTLQARLGYPYIVRTWIDSNRNLIEALKLEKTVMFIILTLIVTVACFNIASALIMTVLEKTKDIGILKAIGASNINIMAIFALQGGIIGILGTVLGAFTGISACWCLKTYKFINLPRDVYYIDKLPVKIEPQDITVILVSSILISLLAAIYPSYKASRLNPVEVLRYE